MTLETALLCRDGEAARNALALIMEHFETSEAISMVEESLNHLDPETVWWFIQDVAPAWLLARYESWVHYQLTPSEPSSLDLCAHAIPAFLEMLAECQDPFHASLWRRQIQDDINLSQHYPYREQLIKRILDSIGDSPELIELFQELIES